MTTVHSSLLISAMVFCVNSAMAQEAGQAVTLQYGTVESVGVVHNDGKRAGGAVVGDCVVVEQGQYTNVRRVSSINCYVDQQPAHHVEAANNCQKAKDELNNANTNDEIEQAVIKVRTLCED